MKSDMTHYTGNAKVIYVLSLWLTPDMWQEKTLFAEIKEVIQKLTEQSSYQLSERELYLTQELTNGLLEATLASFDKADDFQKDELGLALNDITKFLSFLEISTENH
tara:strand:+ start:1495 stop:1815 length:321 start_codon:yes stop_codon:yes gene_type:complete